MAGNVTDRILDGSRAYQTWRVISRESFIRRTLAGLHGLLSAIMRGSRIVAFLGKRVAPAFTVGDYLDKQVDFLPMMLGSSRIWVKLNNLLKKLTAAFGRGKMMSVLNGSITVNLLVSRQASISSPHRRAMAMLVIYVLAYYLLRLILLAIFKDAGYYSGWAGGIVLGLILAAIYLNVSQRTDSDVK